MCGRRGGNDVWGALSLCTYISHRPSLRRHMENVMNEIILALTWFESLLAWSRGRVPILRSLKNQAEIKVFISDGPLNKDFSQPQFPFFVK